MGSTDPAPTVESGAAPESSTRIGTYELVVIIPATYSDEEAPTLKQKVNDLLVSLGAKVTEREDLGKRKLAFPIKHIRQGFYELYKFEGPKTILQKIDQELGLLPEVLRHLVTIRTVRTKEQLEAEAALRERIQQKRMAAEEKAVAERQVKELETMKASEATKPAEPTREVSPEELTKKLDELLDESISE